MAAPTDLNDSLALLNAVLNGTSGLLLLAGWRAIRGGQRELHRKLMMGAFGVSAVFLVSYLTRVALGGTHPYPEGAPYRGFYLAMLASHVLLAASVPVFAIGGIRLGLQGRYEAHKKLMRVGLPVWGYVSVTGVGVYLMLYQLAGV
jgi:putative membrane protein